MICKLANIRYFLLTIKAFSFINPLIFGKAFSSCFWQSINSFSNFASSLHFELNYLFSCIKYKDNIYVVFFTLEDKWMMMVYNPINDTWNKFDLDIEKYEVSYEGKLIIANDCLFFAQVCNVERYSHNNKFISRFEINTKDRLLIPIIEITQPRKMRYIGYMSHNLIFGFENKISIIEYIRHIGITYDVSTSEQQEYKILSVTRV